MCERALSHEALRRPDHLKKLNLPQPYHKNSEISGAGVLQSDPGVPPRPGAQHSRPTEELPIPSCAVSWKGGTCCKSLHEETHGILTSGLGYRLDVCEHTQRCRLILKPPVTKYTTVCCLLWVQGLGQV